MFSTISLLLSALAAVSALPVETTPSTIVKRGEWGIADGALSNNGISIGFLPDFDVSSVSSLNAVLPAGMAVVGDYISISSDDTSLGGEPYHKSDIMSQSTKPVYMATIELSNGLYDFNSDQADVISYAMKELTDAGVPVWVRFAYEMNGCPAWNAWGCDATGFKQAWGIMASSLRNNAPSAKLLWSPNIDTSGSDGQGNYADYYPGDDSVDLVGLSFYWFGEDQQENTVASSGLFTSQAAPFYNAYAEAKGKPFVLSETSGGYHYYTGTSTPALGGASEYDIKTNWLDQILGADTKAMFPNMIAAVWFNYEKDERDQTIDYRGVLGNSAVQGAFAGL
ncbi:glycoside hydrolase family 26 protein [Calocera viscosa TUFC12733]|uniref:Glycoside hydrolase family 26 protein n=1 Tax=Calocera viscosa (strain TUFC12733) TaxID=1330018 RepID=A0A167KXV5_CALVF|nr:glycoside hydrolase family 26 protein [Calocera viscosa TUFC12733]